MSNDQYLRDNLGYSPETGDVFFKRRGRGRQVGKPIRGISSGGYYTVAIVAVGYKGYAHRIAWFLHHGNWPDDCIDHINGDKRDNRIENLRDVTRAINNRNRTDHTEDTGVRFRKDRKCWQAYVSIDGSWTSLGHFGCKTSAQLTRRIKEKELGYV